MANLLAKLKKDEEAEKEFIAAIDSSKNKNYPEGYKDYGIFLADIGKTDDARDKLKTAINLFQNRDKPDDDEELKEAKEKLKSLG